MCWLSEFWVLNCLFLMFSRVQMWINPVINFLQWVTCLWFTSESTDASRFSVGSQERKTNSSQVLVFLCIRRNIQTNVCSCFVSNYSHLHPGTVRSRVTWESLRFNLNQQDFNSSHALTEHLPGFWSAPDRFMFSLPSKRPHQDLEPAKSTENINHDILRTSKWAHCELSAAVLTAAPVWAECGVNTKRDEVAPIESSASL